MEVSEDFSSAMASSNFSHVKAPETMMGGLSCMKFDQTTSMPGEPPGYCNDSRAPTLEKTTAAVDGAGFRKTQSPNANHADTQPRTLSGPARR
jgi:hypothetical protein